MQIIGKVSARLLIHLGAVEMVATILICYAVAVKEGHVKPWLPTISACGEKPPEVFLFRYGIVAGAVLLMVEAVALYGAGLSSKLALVLGMVAPFCLGVVGVVAADELDVVHTTCAVIFFVFEDVVMVLLMKQAVGKVSRFSLIAKGLCTAVACLATVGRLVLVCHCLPAVLHIESSIALPLVEWSNTLAIVFFQWTYSLDLTSLYIAEVEDDERKGEGDLEGEFEGAKGTEKQKFPL